MAIQGLTTHARMRMQQRGTPPNAVEDLLDRLRAGKIYAPDKVAWALEHFFKDQNLHHLRELALREVATVRARCAVLREVLELAAEGDLHPDVSARIEAALADQCGTC